MKHHMTRIAAVILTVALAIPALAGCMQVNGDRVALVMDNEQYGRAEALLYFHYEQYDTEYNMYSLADALYNGLMNYWQYSNGDYSSIGMLRENAMQNMIQTKMLCKKAAQDGVELSSDEETLLTRTVNRFLREYTTVVTAAEANKETITAFVRENMLANKEYMHITDSIDKTYDEEAMRRKRADGLTVMAKLVDGEARPQEEQKEIIEGALKEIELLLEKGETPESIKALFDDDEDAEFGVNVVGEGPIQKPENYEEGKDPESFEALVWGLKTGEHGTLCTLNASDNYSGYAARCLDDNDEKLKEEAIQTEMTSRRRAKFQEIYDELRASYKKIHVYTEVVDGFNVSETLYDGKDYKDALSEDEITTLE